MLTTAITIGAVLGFLEWVILVASRQKLDKWIYIQSVSFWFTCGVMIGLIESSLPSYLAGSLIAGFLCIPWFINISIIPKQYSHLPPLLISSLLLGAMGGFLKAVLGSWL